MTGFYRGLVWPWLRLLTPETAHGLSLWALKHGLVYGSSGKDDPLLACRVWGRDFANPLGMAAGYDKNAEALTGLFKLGFGFVEAGSVTPRPQAGNPKPRMFRLEEDEAVIQRLGFNNKGLTSFTARLRAFSKDSARPKGLLGANLGKNKETQDAAADYVEGVYACAPFVDYLVVNVSSPNTPGLRDLQGRAHLSNLLSRVVEARKAACAGLVETLPPLLLKIAPDQQVSEYAEIAQTVLTAGIDGLIISNTTVSRPQGLHGPHLSEIGGLSGPSLFPLSTRVLAEMYDLTQGKLPIIGVGGISSGAEAYEKIRAGASLVQLYTAMVYHGPGLVARIKRELADCLRRDGFGSMAEAVGADHR
ncbi:MAG: quinone-dependent dihydroorotate dehydrogenase [Rhodospirillaceae bacterium]|nr:quinone-dependent dihydroorotate dehydrogenase [Rhodospirillaceae bacterium]MBT5373859.1 quinone-dependent dihydroorotate dehydrogenase [Rhodospirillaceae bacterium]